MYAVYEWVQLCWVHASTSGSDCSISSEALHTHSRYTDMLSRIRQMITPSQLEVSKSLLHEENENRDFLTLCWLVLLNSGNGHKHDVHAVLVAHLQQHKMPLLFVWTHTVLHTHVLQHWPHQVRPAVFPSIKRLAAITSSSPLPTLISREKLPEDCAFGQTSNCKCWCFSLCYFYG